MRAMIVAGLMAVAGCSAAPHAYPPPPTAGMIETIRYETGPCFGACPVYVLTVRSDGTGTFGGKQHTAVQGVRDFTITPAQYSDFRGRLQPYRPSGDRRFSTGPECNGRVATDLPSVEISWSAKGPQSRLYAYFGCDMEGNAAMFEALRRAPEALPQVQAMIGTR